MATYPCSNCGATADTQTGCPNCGSTLDAEISELNRTIHSMQQRNKTMVEDRQALMQRLQGAIAIRSLLRHAKEVQGGGAPGKSRIGRVIGGVGRPMSMPVRPPKRGVRSGGVPKQAANGPQDAKAEPGTVTTAVKAAPGGGGHSERPPGQRPPPPKQGSGGPKPPPASASAEHHNHPPHAPETSARTAQNLVLAIGAIVMVGAIGMIPFFYSGLGSGAKATSLIVLTAIAIFLPVMLGRRGLITTSEWLTPVPLMLILVDGWALWHAQLHGRIDGSVYAGAVFAAAAAVSAGYQRFTGLAVPRFLSILLLQPVPTLVLYTFVHDAADWAAILTATAAVDLFVSLRSHRSETHGRYLRFAIRRLQETVNLAGLVYGTVALLHANSQLESFRSGATVVASAVVGLAAGLLFRQFPLPHIATGIATLASIGGFAKMAAFALPGSGLLAASAAIAAHAFTVRLLPRYARKGAQIAAALAAVATAGDIIYRAWKALTAPVRATSPAWTANLDAYHHLVATQNGHASAVLVPATLLLSAASWVMLPRTWRLDGVLTGIALAAILAPGSYALSWPAAIEICVLVSLGIGIFGLTVKTTRESWVCIATAFAVGGYATTLSIARPLSQTITLMVIAIGGATIGAAGMRTPGRFNLRVAEAGWGAAAFALPGAVAAFTAAVSRHGQPSPTAILAAAFVATAGTLAAAAISQVARRRASPMIASGAALGALAVTIASLRSTGVARNDVAVAFTLLVSAMLMCIPAFAPQIGELRDRRFLGLDADEFAAAAVTAAVIAALARVGALIVGGSTAVVMAGLVLLIAIGTRAMPAEWRRGPTAGGTVVGGVVALATGFAALDAAIAVIRANHPVWKVETSGWAHEVAKLASATGRSPSTPLALLLLAAASAFVLSRRNTQIAVSIAVGFTALALPVTLHTGWWGPGLFSGVVATATGVLAAATRDRGASMATATVATVLFADTITTSLVSRSSTAATLIVSAVINGAVTWTAARTLKQHPAPPIDVDQTETGRAADKPTKHLVLIGGGALSGGVLALGGGGAATAAAGHASSSIVSTGAFAGLLIALGAIAACRRPLDPFLLHATAAISIGGLIVACANVTQLSQLGLFAAFAAFLSVLAELVRASQRSQPQVQKWLARKSVVLAAAGPATALATGSLALTLFAVLFGPYQVFGSVWDLHPKTSVEALGSLESLIAQPIAVVTAVLLTIALTLGAVGFGGSNDVVLARVVAVVTPGVAGTLLITPFVLDWGWPAGPTFALLVGAISGLSIAFSIEPADTDAASALRAARKLVLGICILAGGAGVAGSLATQPTTALAMAMATVAGLAAALWGRVPVSRVTGWVVTAVGAEMLALVLCAMGGVGVADSSFAVGAVAAGLLLLGAMLPRLRMTTNTEAITVEASAYAGGVMGLVLAAHDIHHLAIFLACWGAALGIAAVRAQRPQVYRSILLWTAAAHELAAWCIFLSVSTGRVPPEAYTLGIALVALITGWIELRWNPELTSWVTYGVALTAALGPSLAITIGADHATARDLLLLGGAAAATIIGSIRRQQAPIIIGGIALLATLGNNIARYSPTGSLVILLVVISAVLISIGANYEKRRRNIRNVWHLFNRMQ